MIKKTWIFAAAILFASSLFAADLSLDDVVDKIQGNQKKIKDMYAETVTTITSNMALPGAKDKGPQTMVQKGKMWTKGQKLSKIEMLSPMKQTTITNGDKMAIINAETGQKMVQDLSKVQGPRSQVQGEMNLERAKEFFDLSVGRKGGDYVITGVPKKDNKFLGKMEFYVDGGRWVPVKILMYDAKGKPMSQSEIEYKEISGVWTPLKNRSNVTTPMGQMKVEMSFENIKVNQGISDREFRIE